MTMTTLHERDLQLLTLLHDGTPVSVAGPQVGMSASDAHQVATDYGYPNRRKIATAMANLADRPAVDDVPTTDAEQAGVDLTHPGEADPAPNEREHVARLTDRVQQLERQLAAERLRANALEAGPGRVAATEEQWTQLWLDRMAKYVERGKASTTAKLPRYAKQLEEAAANLLQGLDEEAKRAQVQAEIDKLEAQLAKLRGDRTKTVGVREYDPKAVRAWAKANGIDVNPTGRVPSDVVARWQAANPVATS